MIASFSKYVFKQLDIDAIGAIMGAVFQAAEEEGNALEFSGLEIQINEFKQGFRFAVACEDAGVLGVISDKDIQIGLVRASMKKYAPLLGKAMKKMLTTSNQAAMEDLKDLFSSDGL
jgi:predicted regulator of Ras-like GTPase activity (Roadblock/LC7/MglB family)